MIDKDLIQRFIDIFPSSPLSTSFRSAVRAERDKDGKLEGTYYTLHRSVTAKDVEDHIAGRLCIVAKPQLADGKSLLWASGDSDEYGPEALARCEARIRKHGLPLHCFVSKSGGVHQFLFLSEPQPAAAIRPLVLRWMITLGYPATVEVFPKQDVIDANNLGVGLALPFFGEPEAFARFEPQRYRYVASVNGNGHSPEPTSASGLRVPDGVNLRDVLATKLKFRIVTKGDTTYFSYHGLQGASGQRQPCLIRGVIHEENRSNARQSSFVQQGDRFWHTCFAEGCRDRWFMLEQPDTHGFENTTAADLVSKTRQALMTLDEIVTGPSVYDALCGSPITQPTPQQVAARVETLDTVLVMERFSDVVAKPIVWLWPERIPAAKLSIFSGNPDEGKTTVFCDVTGRYTTGRNWPDDAKNELPPGDVLILNAEDDAADTLKPRLMASGADLLRVHYLKCVRVSKGAKKLERMLALDTDLGALERSLAEHPNIRLVGIDPITGYLGRADMNKEQELRRVLTPIAELAERTGVTFIGLGHFNKRSDVRAVHRVGGAVAMSGVARAVWMFMRDPKAVEPNKYLMLLGKGNLTRKRTGLRYGFAEKKIDLPDGSTTSAPVIEWNGDATDDAETVLEVAADSKGKSQARAEQFLQECLAGRGERTSDWIEAEADKRHISRNALFGAKKEKGVRAFRKNGKWWWVWDSKSPGA